MGDSWACAHSEQPQMSSEGKRWTIEICAECERRLGSPGEPHVHGCETGISRTVEVAPASEVERLREALQRIATAELWADSENPNDTPQEIARAALHPDDKRED